MAKCIMIQGTMSNAGKSLLAAGLCRIFKQDGYQAAPFKSQNMALNSYITKEGLEMGRAQVVQAEAAGVEPTVSMNPILLKPSSDTGSQVIVNGKPIGSMGAREYFAFKSQLVPEIKKAYEKLNREFDVIVIEGAGSPAEINLKSDDIVNMGMAKMADAPVLLVGDIDRGGVFAQLYGTVMLLPPEERSRIKGLVINKFRGDKSLLDSGVSMIEELCEIPVTGVLPFMKLDIEEEDSLSETLNGKGAAGVIDITVLRFPRMSNYTDFNAFSRLPGVSVRYVSRLQELHDPDLLILPGTKNTIEDLLWMRQNGLEAASLKLISEGIPVIGVCGGYQMMGEWLHDPDGIEGEAGREPVMGMGLFPHQTVYAGEKTRTRVRGRFGQVSGLFHSLSGMKIEGYEIHMGLTEAGKDHNSGCYGITAPLVCLTKYQETGEKWDGSQIGSQYGTYVHGIFDGEGIARSIVMTLMEKKGIFKNGILDGEISLHAYKEEQYDLLAQGIREHLDMKAIYEMMGLFKAEMESTDYEN